MAAGGSANPGAAAQGATDGGAIGSAHAGASHPAAPCRIPKGVGIRVAAHGGADTAWPVMVGGSLLVALPDFVDEFGAFLARYATNGVRLGATRLDGSTYFMEGALWTGSSLAVLSLQRSSPSDILEARLFDGLGQPLGPTRRITSDSRGPSDSTALAAHSGSGFGVAWRSSIDLRFRAFDATLAPLGSEIALTDPGYAGTSPQVVSSGKEFAIVWLRGGAVHMTRVGLDGTHLTPTPLVVADGAKYPRAFVRAVWTGASYTLLFETDSGELALAAISETGASLAAPVVVTKLAKHSDGTGLDLAWNGTDLAAAWVDDSAPPAAPLFVRRYTPSLTPHGPAAKVADAAATPRLAWAGDEYVVTFGSTLQSVCD
ncbi:MAG: hypothetical protein IPG50_34950 [Myxococcales bacterium]|nr:hypothetical protein [Myxococcales bacterium]